MFININVSAKKYFDIVTLIYNCDNNAIFHPV